MLYDVLTSTPAAQDILAEHIHDIVGESAAIDPSEPNHNKAVRDLLAPARISQFGAEFTDNASIAFVGGEDDTKKDSGARVVRTALQSCLGLWASCGNKDRAALHYHHGSHWGEAEREAEFFEQFHAVVADALRQWMMLLNDAALA